MAVSCSVDTKGSLSSIKILHRSCPKLTVAHLISVRQAEGGHVNHAVRQVDVETAYAGLQVTELVQDHHAALHDRKRCTIRNTVFRRVLLCQVTHKCQLLQTCNSLWVEQKKKNIV